MNLDNTILNISGKNFDDTKISSGNIVGSFTLKGVQLNINCRFGNQFLAYMIASTSGYIELENFGGISNQKSLGEWILLLYWKNRLKHAFAQGIYKSYKKKRENLTTVRGAIDINQWLKKDFFDGKTLCEFKEHSYDNNINKIVYLAIQKISKSLYSNLLNDIYEIKRAFMNIPFSNLNHNFVDDRVSNPYYKNYNEVYNLSKQILQDKFMNLSSDKLNFSAFLFDISLLFEHHVRKVLKRKYMLKPKDLVEFKVPNGITENNLFPDIIIDYGDNNIGVFDVKYKRFKTEGKYKGVNREDRFQLISYVAYYSNKYNVINSGFIYPCEEEGFVDKNRTIS
ncbi:MAG: McrC family protein [Cytophagales bacterium]|nr:McrC family protein [Cytophagales bacterium]